MIFHFLISTYYQNCDYSLSVKLSEKLLYMVENNIGFSEMAFKDIRPAPEGFTLAHSVKETITLIEKAEKDGAGIDLIDCDHDLGDYFSDGGDGIKLLDWLCERQTFYPIALHTAKPVGRNNMLWLIRRHSSQLTILLQCDIIKYIYFKDSKKGEMANDDRFEKMY